MIQIRLENQEFELVKDVVIAYSINFINDNSYYILINADKKFFELLLDYAGDLLATKGVTNGEVNAFGYSIESLIDKLTTVIYE